MEEHFDNRVQEDIELFESLRILAKRKVFIAGAIILSFAIGLLIIRFSAKVYRVDTAFLIGRVGNEAVESQEQIKSKIQAGVYEEKLRKMVGDGESKYPNVKVEEPKNTSLILMSIETFQTERAKLILSQIGRLLIEEHKEKIEAKKRFLEQDIERIRVKLASLEKEKDNIGSKVQALQRTLPYEQDPGAQFALFDTKEQFEKKKQEIEDLYRLVLSEQNALEDIQFSRVIKEPFVDPDTVRPRKLFILALSLALGFSVSIFYVLAAEYWTKSSRKNPVQNFAP